MLKKLPFINYLQAMYEHVSTRKCVDPNSNFFCSDDVDCNDGLQCSDDSCNLLTGECQHVLKDNCCGNGICEVNESHCYQDCGPFNRKFDYVQHIFLVERTFGLLSEANLRDLFTSQCFVWILKTACHDCTNILLALHHDFYLLFNESFLDTKK